MYYDKFLPFYMTYADSSLYSRERIQEQEFALIRKLPAKFRKKLKKNVSLWIMREADFMMSIRTNL